MRISILTEGGMNIGFGHVMRCASIYEAFEEKGITPEFVINSDAAVKDLLKEKKYRFFNWLESEEKLSEAINGASAVIIDSYLAGIGFYNKIMESTAKAVYVDDNKRLDYPKGLVLNGSICAEEIDYPKKAGTDYLLGSQYLPLRKEFWDARKKDIRDNVQDIMVTFGGDDMSNMTPKALRLLSENYPNLKKHVIIGKAFQRIKEVEKEADISTSLIYYPTAEKMKEVMMNSDLAISSGGQTLYEMASVGLPAVGVCLSENQQFNLSGFHNSGFLKYAGRYDDKDLNENILKMIKYFQGAQERKKSSSIGQKLVDGQGAKRVVDHVLPLT